MGQSFIDNSKIPGSPEFGKGYKPANNSGCCSQCNKTEESESSEKVKIGCVVRHTRGGIVRTRSCSSVSRTVC